MNQEKLYKGCILFVVQISNNTEANYITDDKDNDFLRKYHILQHFLDVFLEEVPGLPPHYEGLKFFLLDFIISFMTLIELDPYFLYRLTMHNVYKLY